MRSDREAINNKREVGEQSKMIAPDVWFTLYVLAKEGAVHKRAVLTTRRLGDLLGVSQQTASRRVTYCAEEGYVNRVHTANGMLVQLSKTGVKELKKVMTGLELAFVPFEEEIVIAGRVVHGLGQGAYYVDAYASRFHEALGFEPFLGTLNVKIVDDDSRSAINRMKQTPPLIVPGFTHEGRTFGDVVCYRVKINQKIDGAVVIAQRTHHGQEIQEIISEVNLRNKLKLKDNDIITFTIVPLHKA